MEFNDLIADFATRHGVENLMVEDSVAALDIDGIVVSLVSKDDTLVLSADIGEPPSEGEVEFADILLESNLQSDSVFAKSSESGLYLVLRRMSLTLLDSDGFDSALESFVNLVETWRQALVDFRPLAKTAAEKASSEGPAFGSSGFMQV